MKKLIQSLINYDFWVGYNTETSLKDGLKIFFDNGDKALQEVFLRNFTYPASMSDKPVRLNPDTGEIYYVINLNSKELFMNEATLQAAFAQSVSILQQQLPIGITTYMVPEIEGRIEESFSLLITISPTYSHIGIRPIIMALLKPSIITLSLITITSLILSYV